jgi:transposase
MKVYIGIDWSEQKHQVCFMNEAGAVIQQMSVEHSVEGFLKLEAARQKLGVSPKEVVVGLETAHNLLIDMLIERSYPAIYILPPNQVKSNAGRYAQSGAKDDTRDAWVIADMLRTDRGRLHAWQPDSLLTRQIQAQVRMVLFLTRMIQRQSNHLRAILVRYYPAMLDIFSRLDSPTSLAFLEAYPIPQEAVRLTYEQFTQFLRVHHHTHRAKWATMYAQLNHDYPQAHSDTGVDPV